jgi:hypothetical protein
MFGKEGKSVLGLTETTCYGEWGWGSAVGTATGYDSEGREIGVRVPVRTRFLSVSGAHSASYSMGTGGSFPGGKVEGA